MVATGTELFTVLLSSFHFLKLFFQLNFKNKQKTEDSNKVFNSVQESIAETTKPTKKKPMSKVKKTLNAFLIVVKVYLRNSMKNLCNFSSLFSILGI